MNPRFLLLFAATITLMVLTVRTGETAFSSGGAPAAAGLLVFGGLAVIGLVALVRFVYLDGLASARRRKGRRA